jgi:glucokinase
MAGHYIGIDIGGTNIKAALTDVVGTVLEAASAPTPDKLPQLIETIAGLANVFQSKTPVSAVGVGVAGLRNSRTHRIEVSPNLPCVREVNLEERLTEVLGLPVVTENDANAAAYGEWVSGAGKGLQHLVYITLGTGLGCALILDGRLFRGVSGYAGELGHTAMEVEGRPCACGSRGCLETRVSATGIVQTTREKDPQTKLNSAEAVYRAATAGDAVARSVFAETGRFLGLTCANVINLLNPQAIVIGGGVMASGELLLAAAREEVQRRAFRSSARDCEIVQSQLWPDAGTIGAAMLARDAS